MAANPRVGDLVVPAPSYRESMGTGEGAAVLLGILRGTGKLYYPSTDRTFWVPLRKIRPIPREAVTPQSLELLLGDLLLCVEAYDCSVARFTGDGMALEVEVPGLARARLEELRALLGERLHDWIAEPGSMKAVLLKLELVRLPRAVGAGR